MHTTTLTLQTLGSRQRQRILRHFLALSPEDRMLRFGHVLTDEVIERQVAALDFRRDRLFGLVRGRTLVALAHLALRCQDAQHQPEAELGLSVLASARTQGLGSRLFTRALQECRELGVRSLFMHFLASNQTMLHIARKAGMQIVHDHGEADAWLMLPQTPHGLPASLPQERGCYCGAA